MATEKIVNPSIKAAESVFGVFAALKAQVNVKGAIITPGKDAESIRCVNGRTSVEFDRGDAGAVRQLATNMFVPTIHAALVQLRADLAPINAASAAAVKKGDTAAFLAAVEEARQMAYHVISQHGISLSVWAGRPDEQAFIAGRKFTATCPEQPTVYYTKDDVKKENPLQQYRWVAEFIQPVKGENSSLNTADILDLEEVTFGAPAPTGSVLGTPAPEAEGKPAPAPRGRRGARAGA